MDKRVIEKILFGVFFAVLIASIIVRFYAGVTYEFFNVIKPATVIQYGGFLSFALLIQIIKPLFERIPKRVISLFIIFGFFAMMATLFEVFWAFGYWFANYQLDVLNGEPQNSAILDNATYIPSNELRSVYLYDSFSLNLAAKKNMLYFAMAAYFTYILHTIWLRKHLLEK